VINDARKPLAEAKPAVRIDFFLKELKVKAAVAERMPIIASAITISIRVNPFLFFINIPAYYVFIAPSISQYNYIKRILPKLSDCHPAKKNAGGFPNKFLMTPAKQLS